MVVLIADYLCNSYFELVHGQYVHLFTATKVCAYVIHL